MAMSTARPRGKKPKVLIGDGPVVPVRCCVCSEPVGKIRLRKSVVGNTHLKGWCKKHLPEPLTS